MQCPKCGKGLVRAQVNWDLQYGSEHLRNSLLRVFPFWSIKNPVLICLNCDASNTRDQWRKVRRCERGCPDED